MKPFALTIFLAAVIVMPGTALATWGWLKGSAISEFTDTDWEVFKREGVEVLEDGADGVTVDWENPDTGAHGSIKPLATFMYEGRPCRTTAFRNFSRRGTKGQSVLTVCQQEDGTWKLAPDGTEPHGSSAADDGQSGGAR